MGASRASSVEAVGGGKPRRPHWILYPKQILLLKEDPRGIETPLGQSMLLPNITLSSLFPYLKRQNICPWIRRPQSKTYPRIWVANRPHVLTQPSQNQLILTTATSLLPIPVVFVHGRIPYRPLPHGCHGLDHPMWSPVHTKISPRLKLG